MHINQIRTLLATTPPTNRAGAAQANGYAFAASLRTPAAIDLHRLPESPRHWR
jgi:hypothetical protein